MAEKTTRSARSGAGAAGTRSAAPRRADAERTITAILDAALRCFAEGPDATVTQIAKAAGVGRVTVYGHFDSLEAIVDALLTRSLREAEAMFDDLDLESGTAAAAVDRLLHAPWILGRYRGLFEASTRYLGAQKMRTLHDPVFSRVEAVLVRGQKGGEFRTDLPLPWLMATFYALAHAAVAESDAGRFTPEEAADLLSSTLLGMLDAGAQR